MNDELKEIEIERTMREHNYDELAKIFSKCLEGDRHLAYDLIVVLDGMHQANMLDEIDIRMIVSQTYRRQITHNNEQYRGQIQ